MQVKKGELQVYIQYLEELKIEDKPKASVGRTALKDKFVEQLQTYGETQVTLIDEFEGWENKKEGKYDAENKELTSALDELANEETTVDVQVALKKDVIEWFENYEGELSGQNAEMFGRLYLALTEKENE